MNPESITITKITRNDVLHLLQCTKAALTVGDWMPAGNDYEVSIAIEAMKQLQVKMMRKALNKSVQSIKLNRMEYLSVMLVNDLAEFDERILIRNWVDQIDPKL